jgi:hypothetical protein
MGRKSICCVGIALLFGLATASYGIVIGDFEQQMDNFGVAWETPAATLSYSTIGVTRGSSSLAIQSNKVGWQWMIMHSGIVDIASTPILKADVTVLGAEWPTSTWVNFKEVALNSDGPDGWMQVTPTDPVNLAYPGSFNPPADSTRTLTWDFTGYDATGATWMQIVFSQNFDGTTLGKYYIDNVQLVPEPMTMTLLGLGGLSLLRRRR